MTRTFRFWICALFLVGLFAPVSIRWVDKPIAIWVYNTFGSSYFGETMASSPALSIPLVSAIVFIVLGLLAIIGRRFSPIERAVLVCNVSVLTTHIVKDELKVVFGRTWPDSWAPGILSLIQENQYGFHFFHYGVSFESFPSGHAAVVAAVIFPLWIMFPNLRILCAICIAAADIGLVLLNLHFVSDVVAGTFVGASIGLFSVALWEAANPEHSPNPTM